MRWNKNGYTVTVRINLLLWAMVAVIYAPLIPATHADIACFVVDTLAGVIC